MLFNNRSYLVNDFYMNECISVFRFVKKVFEYCEHFFTQMIVNVNRRKDHSTLIKKETITLRNINILKRIHMYVLHFKPKY